MAQAPDRDRTLNGDEIDELLRPSRTSSTSNVRSSPGYSRGVADLVAAAARIRRMPEADITRLYRAGLVHGLGKLGVSNHIWEKTGIAHYR